MRKLIATALGVALALTATVALAGRNSSGTMSFTSVAGGYPFQSGQTISSAGVNSNFSELATELSDSLSRSGKGGMSAPLRCADGTAAAPAFSWTSDTNTGFYRPAADTIGVSLAGTDYLDFASTRIWSHINLEFSGASDRFVVQSGSARLFLGTSSGNNSDVGIQRNGTVMLGFTATIEANSNRITGVGTPTAAADAATKGYVDSRSAGQQITASSGAFSTSSTTYVDVTNLTTTITTTGRPVVIAVQPTPSTSDAGIVSVVTGAGGGYMYLAVVRDSTVLGAFDVGSSASSVTMYYTPSFVFLDAPAAGTYTYKIQAKVIAGTSSGTVTNCSLAVYTLP